MLGFFLITINISSNFLTLRNKNIHLLPNFKKDTILPNEALNLLKENKITREETLRSVTFTVHNAITHYGPGSIEERKKYNILLPFTENYILFALSFLNEKFTIWEFYDYKKAIYRGVGVCSQYAIVVDQVLGEKGIPSKLISLGGHVVTTAELSKNNWWILDADFGLVIPLDIKQIEEDPKIVIDYYIRNGQTKEKAIEISKYYGPEGNYIGNNFYSPRQKIKQIIQFVSYYLKWIIPIVLLVLPFRKNKKSI